MDATAFLEDLKKKPWYQDQAVHLEHLPLRVSSFEVLTHPLHPLLQERLEALGLVRLYSHQVEAIDALLRGEHVVVATPAASGKSLCYHIPVLQALLEERAARALLILSQV